jgi:hypothetical protein
MTDTFSKSCDMIASAILIKVENKLLRNNIYFLVSSWLFDSSSRWSYCASSCLFFELKNAPIFFSMPF